MCVCARPDGGGGWLCCVNEFDVCVVCACMRACVCMCVCVHVYACVCVCVSRCVHTLYTCCAVHVHAAYPVIAQQLYMYY